MIILMISNCMLKIVSSKNMTSGPPLTILFKFTVPLLLGNLLQQTYSIVDAVIVGKSLGINSLAAVGAGTSVITLILGFCSGCCGGFGIPMAQKFGAQDFATLYKYIIISLKISAVISVAIASTTSILCSYILKWMQTPEIIMNEAYLYLLITFLGIPFIFYYNLFSSILRAVGDSKTPFFFLIFSTFVNIILDLLTINVLDYGVAGAAVATVLSQGLSASLCYVYIKRKYDIFNIQHAKEFDSRVAKQLLYIGIPMGLQVSITAIGMIMLQSANNSLGTVYIAAFTAAMRIKIFFVCLLESLGIAMATFSGQNYGAGKLERIYLGIKSALSLVFAYVVILNIIVWKFSKELILLFVDVSETYVIENAILFIRISAVFFIVLGISFTLRYTIQGMGYTRLSLLSGVSEMLARTYVSLFAVPVFKFRAICFGDPIAWCFAVFFLFPAFKYVYKKCDNSENSKKCTL